MAPTIAIITPTLGRPTLARTLDSTVRQLRPGDEWFVVGDGPRPAARHAVEALGHPQVHYLEHADPSSSFGNAQRNLAMRLAKANYFVFLDDDDVFLPWALDAVRKYGELGVPLMFRMDYRPCDCLVWRTPQFYVGNVAGAVFAVPRIEGRWCPWPEVSGRQGVGDFHFIESTLALWPPGSLGWADVIITICHGHGGGRV